MRDQVIVFATLAIALVLFVKGRPRYDAVAVFALRMLVLSGVVAPEDAFSGFGHPAVVTVAAVLVLSRGLQNAGIVDALARLAARLGGNPSLQVFALCLVVAVCSAFMNNVGALALLMPVAIHAARKYNLSPSVLLMPVAFASLLGGMTTLVGTPPNIIIASFREQTGTSSFGLFDFLPVGGLVLVTGVFFLAVVGWRLIPQRKQAGEAGSLFEVGSYMTEIGIDKGSALVGKTVRDLCSAANSAVVVTSLIRAERTWRAPWPGLVLQAGDVLVLEADEEAIQTVVSKQGVSLVGGAVSREALEDEETLLVEAVVPRDSALDGRTFASSKIADLLNVNLLALARSGERLTQRLSALRIRAGDVLLLQGTRDAIQQAIGQMGALPLAERDLRIGKPRRAAMMLLLFAGALAAGGSGVLPLAISFVTACAIAIVLGLVTPNEAYDAVDWPVIILLGAMIPVGLSIEETGGAQAIARLVVDLATQIPPVATLGIVLVTAMFLSDIVNNAAAAVIMAPIAIRVADGMGASPDPFLMAVCIGASCAFLTPIGHQSNTLVMGPGGYRFGDYWRVGLPLEIIVAVVTLTVLPRVWPLYP